jgi:hypothetical protein
MRVKFCSAFDEFFSIVFYAFRACKSMQEITDFITKQTSAGEIKHVLGIGKTFCTSKSSCSAVSIANYFMNGVEN